MKVDRFICVNRGQRFLLISFPNLERDAMKNALFVLLVLFAFSLPALAQHDLEFSGGYQHVSGDQGLDGFTVAAAYSLIPQFQLYLSYDGVFDHSTIGSFALTTVGTTVVNSHMQSILTGPRFFLPGLFKGKGKIKGHTLHPFLELGFGDSRLHTELRQINVMTA